MGILDEIKASFKSGSTLTKLIYINLAVFLAVKIATVFSFLFQLENVSNSMVYWLSVPADAQLLIGRIWSIFTYMFLHQDFLHILFNMLVMFWFGRIFLHYFDGKKLLSVYLVGGIFGAALYILFFNALPVFQDYVSRSMMLGASASVMAIVVASAVYVPNYTVNLMFLGPVKLKHIAAVYIVMDILSIASDNSGGHIAHLGGALLGFIYIWQYKKGRNFTKGFDRFMDSLFALFKPRKTKKFKVTHKKSMTDMQYNKQKAVSQEDMDRILEKISKYGYDKLTKQEKETLFKMGNKN